MQKSYSKISKKSQPEKAGLFSVDLLGNAIAAT
jgi:hypothetical protein